MQETQKVQEVLTQIETLQAGPDIDAFFKNLREELLPPVPGASAKAKSDGKAPVVVFHNTQCYLEQLDRAFLATPPGPRGAKEAEERHRDLHQLVRSIKLPSLH